MSAYYNEFNPEAAHMLRQLIADGLIAAGDVDERSITEVTADDIKGYTQCHFFAGIGGWSVALRLAGWEDSRPVWTGSCPCQPFSSAGKGGKQSDERHLWPYWYRLIRESKPTIIFGEQVASAITAGWWDDVATGLEEENYACAAAVLPACSVGKPHRRDRLWFVAHSAIDDDNGNPRKLPRTYEHQTEERPQRRITEPSGTSVVGNAELHGRDEGTQLGSVGARQEEGRMQQSKRHGSSLDVVNTKSLLLQGCKNGQGEVESWGDSEQHEWIRCPDGKSRPVEPRICLLAHGVQHRAPILHAFGNAIVPQVAAAFIEATKGVIYDDGISTV